MKSIFCLFLMLFLCAGCVTKEPYGDKEHPFRVAMRDMKKEFKVLENFETDAKLSKEATVASKNLIALFTKAQKMKPAFLEKGQYSNYNQHYTDMIAALNQHLGYLKSGKVDSAQNIYSVLSDLKKKAHDEFSKQAKKYRGAE